MLTETGWISKGYFHGDVVWTDITAFTSALHAQDETIPRIRYSGAGTG